MYIVECSKCRFHAQTGTSELAQSVANQHEDTSKHRGPFVWRVPEWALKGPMWIES